MSFAHFLLYLIGKLTLKELIFIISFGKYDMVLYCNKHFGNECTGCLPGGGDGCLIQRQFIVKMIGNVSTWLFYLGGR